VDGVVRTESEGLGQIAGLTNERLGDGTRSSWAYRSSKVSTAVRSCGGSMATSKLVRDATPPALVEADP